MGSVINCESQLIPIHASAVKFREHGLIFLGPSGTGKSTICRLLGSVATPLADDRIFLISQSSNTWGLVDAKEYMPGEPLPALHDITDYLVPLHAIFRLYQASEPRLLRVSSIERCRDLIGAFLELTRPHMVDGNGMKRAFALLAAVARHTPGYHFHFALASETVAVLEREASIILTKYNNCKKEVRYEQARG